MTGTNIQTHTHLFICVQCTHTHTHIYSNMYINVIEMIVIETVDYILDKDFIDLRYANVQSRWIDPWIRRNT